MTVPEMAQLQPGVEVNIVLKADQRSGRLTGGSISEVDFAYSEPLHKSADILQKQKAPWAPLELPCCPGVFILLQ